MEMHRYWRVKYRIPETDTWRSFVWDTTAKVAAEEALAGAVNEVSMKR